MKQTITLLLFILAFSSQSFASNATIIPMVTTTTHSIDIVKKDGVFLKVAKWVKKAAKSAADLDGKTIALIAHLSWIGVVIAYILNKENPTEIGTFYVRQNIGIWLLAAISSVLFIIPIIGWIAGIVLWILVLIMWISSLINALGEKIKPAPIFGKMFQKWFASVE